MRRLNFKNLIRRFQRSELSGRQQKLMQDWFDSFPAGPERWSQQELDTLKEKTMARIFAASGPAEKQTRRLRLRWLAGSAAALLIGISTYLVFLNQPEATLQNEQSYQEIFPGGNKAILSLPGSAPITLSSSQSGIQMSEQAGVFYLDGSEILSTPDQPAQMLTLETPRGGQYKVTLSDGTQVFLNAESKLTYPARFERGRRVVQLQGEGFFQVQPAQPAQPFIVEMRGQQIEVLGTTFNTSDYEADYSISTTLMEGKVQIHYRDAGRTARSVMLNPGEQSVLLNGRARVEKTDVNEALAWTRGDFIFSDETIEKVMAKIARWYDVEVIYEGEIPQSRIWATMSRSEHIQQALEIIELTALVRFEVKERRVYVKKL